MKISLSPHTKNVHKQFADFFPSEIARPYLYLLSKRLAEGHICINLDEVKSEDFDELYIVSSNIQKDPMVSDGSITKPMILHNGYLYLHRYFKYESIIFNRINDLLSISDDLFQERLSMLEANKKLFRSVFPKNEDKETNWQKVAAITSFLQQFSIITGGPGTGKTTTVSKILQLLYSIDPELKVALAAPTGKAATRMAESIKNNANLDTSVEEIIPSTIHRLLGNIPNSIYFKHNRSNPLPFDLIIIDECSMIDVALFAKLLDAIGPRTRLILLGDKNQLASVEAGSLFGDLCSVPQKLNVFSKKMTDAIKDANEEILPKSDDESKIQLSDHIVELKKSFRFSDDEGIGKLSRIVIGQDLNAFENFIKEDHKTVKLDFDYDEEKFETFIGAFEDYIKEKDISEALKKFNRARVLCAVRGGIFGLYETNKKIEKILEKKGLIRRNYLFYEHRPIMITKNNYLLGLFNGDTGIIRKDENGELKAWFDIKGEPTSFSTSLISWEETAFSITIHKSQGSEFDKVLVLLPNYEVPILTKELIYTAITRSRERVLIQANKEVLKKAISQTVKRGSGIEERFKNNQ